jgi:membrane fusion protein, multidrug efflux system
MKWMIFLILSHASLAAEEMLSEPLTIPVILDAHERVLVYPALFEEIESIPFKLGQHFKKGDVLLKMRNALYKSQLEKAYLATDVAIEDLRVKKSLQEDNLISLLELLQSKANLAAASALKEEALRNFQATRILAPFDGKIGGIFTRVNERPLMEIFNDKKIIAKLIIPSTLLTRFQIGQIIPIYVKDLERSFAAKIIRIGAEINPVSGTVDMEAELDNQDQSLMIGMPSFLTIEQP